MKNRDGKSETIKKEHINKQRELREAIEKVTAEKEAKLKEMLEHADYKYSKIQEERQQKIIEHQRAMEIKNNIIKDRKEKADLTFLKRVEGLKEKEEKAEKQLE